MSTLSVYTKLEMLPDHLKQEAVDFIDFLLTKSTAKRVLVEPRPGSARGKVRMSPDFDAPLDEFKDYM